MFKKEIPAEKMPASSGKKEKKEFLALAVGFLLILVVAIFTMIRNNPEEPSQSQTDIPTLKEMKKSDQKTIGMKDLQKMLTLGDKDSEITLLDIRSFEEYAKEHIIGSINITIEEFPVEGKIDTHNHIIVIGEKSTDTNVEEAVEKLKKEDAKNISVLAGGMDFWKKNSGMTVTYGDPTSFVDQAKVSYVTQEKLNEAIQQKVPMFIIDVRNSEKFSAGHIPGAKNIPFEELEKRRKEITEKKVVVVGNNELEEFQASVQIYDMLLVSPYVLKGGMPKWQENRYLLEK